MTPDPDAARCAELDGCCLTHSPCFEAFDETAQGRDCQGWPCPESRPPAPAPPEPGR